MKGTERHMFLGSNSSEGFFSYFDYILSQKEANKIICIKGGPGTGKSSMLKKIGKYFNEKGYNIEFHHCSSDSDSLDGIVIKELNVAMLDGTAPHVVDPKTPGAVDEILDVGKYWDETKIKEQKDLIMSISKDVSMCFKRAYKYLSAARVVHEDWSSLNNAALNLSKINLLKEDFKNKLLPMPICELGTVRHLFATAFTPSGIVTFVDTLYKNYKEVYILKGGPGTGKTNILNYIGEEALKRGMYVEVFHDPFIPTRIEHILIPELSIALLTSNEINKKSLNGKEINMNEFLDENFLNKYKAEIAYSEKLFYELSGKALNLLSDVKTIRNELEKFYIESMDFDKLDMVYKETIEKIECYE